MTKLRKVTLKYSGVVVISQGDQIFRRSRKARRGESETIQEYQDNSTKIIDNVYERIPKDDSVDCGLRTVLFLTVQIIF